LHQRSGDAAAVLADCDVAIGQCGNQAERHYLEEARRRAEETIRDKNPATEG
jgi:hypothetical protein